MSFRSDRPAAPPRRRRIVLVEFSPSGGLFQFAFQLGDALARAGDDVVLLTGPEPELRSGHPGFEVRPALPTWHPADGGQRRGPWRIARRGVRAARLAAAWVVVARELCRARPGLVLFSYWRFVLDAVAVTAIRRLLPSTQLGIVAHEPLPKSDHRDSSTPRSGPLIRRSFGAAWRGMDLVLVLGESTAELVRTHWEPRGPVVVVPHGDEDALLAGRTVPGVRTTGPTALFFGTWSAYKGIDVLLDAFAQVRAGRPEAALVLAGAVGGDVDLPAVTGRAREIGGIELRPGYVPVDEVAELFGRARVVVLPYVRATQSGVAHLAYSCSRPVVATSVGDVARTVLDGVTGRVVEPGRPDRLAAAMIELLDDAGRAERFGAAGREMLDTGHSWTAVAERVREAAGRCGGGGHASPS